MRTSVSSSAKRRHFRRTFFRGTQARRAPVSRTRSLVIESLENRLLLAAKTIDLAGETGPFTLMDTGGGNAEVQDAAFNLVAPSYTIANDWVTIKGSALDDELNVRYATTPEKGLMFQGGGGSDRLVVTDDGAADLTLIRRGRDGQSGTVTVAPDGQNRPVAFESVQYVQVKSGAGGRVVEFDADPLEMNDTQQNASPYDLLSRIHVQPTIDPAGDQDWYSFVATEKSSYRFDLQFEAIDTVSSGQQGLPGNGELKLEVYDATGTQVSPVSGNEYLLKKQTYYARVSGDVAKAVNLYNLKITNTRETFENGAGQFQPLSGLWTIDREGLNASYRGAADPKDNAIAQFMGAVPPATQFRSFEVTIKADEMIAGPRWSNAFIVFDFDPANPNNDFKFAGVFMGIDKWSIGQRANNANGYDHLEQSSQRFDANTDYRIRVDLTPGGGQTTVDLWVHNGYDWGPNAVLSRTFNQFTHDAVGLLTMRGIAWFDDFADPAPDGVAEEPEPVEPNAVPVAGNDSAATALGQPITIDVLANDRDADSDPLVPAVATTPADGTVVRNPDGSFLYTPEPAFFGTDAFTYKVNDGQVDSEPATVSITVTRPNDPPLATDDSGHTDEDTPITFGVLANDSDPDADPLTVTAVTQGVRGTVVRNGDGTVTYTPRENFQGSDAFTYTISDGRGAVDTGAVQVIINPVNDAPVGRADNAATEQDQAVNIDVLANDADADGDPLWITILQSSGGTAIVNDGGTPNDASDDTVDFTPGSAFHGTASFSYQINDGLLDSNVAEVVVAVARINHEPIALDDQIATDEDAPVNIDVLANDFDTDSESLAVASFTQGTHGRVVGVAGNTLTYTPQTDFHGIDAFTYQIGDGYGGTASATVNVIVNSVNDAPVARDDATNTDSDTAVTIDVISNDFDPDGDPRSVQSVTDGTHGTVVNNSDGTVTYDPKTGYSGLDSFAYTISDGNGGTNTAHVVVSVGSVMYEQDFDDEILDGLDTKLGNWQITDDLFAAYPGDRSYTGQAAWNGNAIVAQAVDGTSSNLEVTVTLNAEGKISGRRWSNAFVIFDYHSPTDFKFAGTFVGLDQWVIGHYAPNANGYVADKVFSEGIDTLTDYAVQLLVEGDTVTLAVHDGQHYLPKVTHTYSDTGGSLRDGSVGVGTMRGMAHFDDLLIKATDRVFGEVGSTT